MSKGEKIMVASVFGSMAIVMLTVSAGFFGVKREMAQIEYTQYMASVKPTAEPTPTLEATVSAMPTKRAVRLPSPAVSPTGLVQ